MTFLDSTFLGVSVQDWLVALGTAVGTFIVLGIAKRLAVRRLNRLSFKDRIPFSDLILDLLRRTGWFFFLSIGLYVAALFIVPPDGWRQAAYTLLVVALLVQVGVWGMGVIDDAIQRRLAREESPEESAADATTFGALSLVMKIVLWSLLGLLILENLTGIRVDTLIASLGVAGVAVALAVQKILGDLFASLSIALDKPFVIGDAINVGDFTGTVEYIGLKSTRLRSLTGEQVIISNSDLLGSRIRNYKRMERRLVILPLGVACNTPQEKLAAVPGMIQEIVEKQDQVTFARAHLKSLGDFTINFEVVYFLETPDYTRFMDAQQAILLAILERFEREKISIPFPTQAVLLEN